MDLDSQIATMIDDLRKELLDMKAERDARYMFQDREGFFCLANAEGQIVRMVLPSILPEILGDSVWARTDIIRE